MAREFLPAQYEQQIPSNTFAYFVREAFRRLWVSKRTSFVAIAMIAMSLLIVGAFLLVSENLRRAVVQAEADGRDKAIADLDAREQEAVSAQEQALDEIERLQDTLEAGVDRNEEATSALRGPSRSASPPPRKPLLIASRPASDHKRPTVVGSRPWRCRWAAKKVP